MLFPLWILIRNIFSLWILIHKVVFFLSEPGSAMFFFLWILIRNVFNSVIWIRNMLALWIRKKQDFYQIKCSRTRISLCSLVLLIYFCFLQIFLVVKPGSAPAVPPTTVLDTPRSKLEAELHKILKDSFR